MPGKPFIPTYVDEHIGRRIQLRRNMLGMSQSDLAKCCGITFQQIQKYECAGNRVAASRLFEIGRAMDTPISFFFTGLPGNLPDETKATRSSHRVANASIDDPMGKNETLEIIRLYWKLSDDSKRNAVMQMLKALNGTE